MQGWWSKWTLDLAAKHDAIAVSADYRLIPEATAEEALDDVHDAFDWVVSETGMAHALKEVYPDVSVVPDSQRVLVQGDSAGGYCAIQLGISNRQSPTPKGRIRVVNALYPYLSLRTPFHTQAYPKEIGGVSQLPVSIVDNHLASIEEHIKKTGKRPVATNIPMLTPSGEFTERVFLAICAEQHGRTPDFFGPERNPEKGKRRLMPEDRIEDGYVVPPLLLVHGIDDAIAPVSGSDRFIDHVRAWGGVEGLGEKGVKEEDVLRYVREPGDHFFEAETDINGAEWIREAVRFLEGHWLK